MWGDRNWDLNENSIVLPICFLKITSCMMVTDRLGSNLDPDSTTSNGSSGSTRALLFMIWIVAESLPPTVRLLASLLPCLGFPVRGHVFQRRLGGLLPVRFPRRGHEPWRHRGRWKRPLWCWWLAEHFIMQANVFPAAPALCPSSGGTAAIRLQESQTFLPSSPAVIMLFLHAVSPASSVSPDQSPEKPFKWLKWQMRHIFS